MRYTVFVPPFVSRALSAVRGYHRYPGEAQCVHTIKMEISRQTLDAFLASGTEHALRLGCDEMSEHLRAPRVVGVVFQREEAHLIGLINA